MTRTLKTNSLTQSSTTRTCSTSSVRLSSRRSNRRKRRSSKRKRARSKRNLRRRWQPCKSILIISQSMGKIRHCSTRCTWTISRTSALKATLLITKTPSPAPTHNRAVKYLTTEAMVKVLLNWEPKQVQIALSLKIGQTTLLTMNPYKKSKSVKIPRRWLTFQDVSSKSFSNICLVSMGKTSLLRVLKSSSPTEISHTRWTESKNWWRCSSHLTFRTTKRSEDLLTSVPPF